MRKHLKRNLLMVLMVFTIGFVSIGQNALEVQAATSYTTILSYESSVKTQKNSATVLKTVIAGGVAAAITAVTGGGGTAISGSWAGTTLSSLITAGWYSGKNVYFKVTYKYKWLYDTKDKYTGTVYPHYRIKEIVSVYKNGSYKKCVRKQSATYKTTDLDDLRNVIDFN